MNYSVTLRKHYTTAEQRRDLYMYADWLHDNVGLEWDMWQWTFTDITTRQLLFYRAEDAVAFRLRFDA